MYAIQDCPHCRKRVVPKTDTGACPACGKIIQDPQLQDATEAQPNDDRPPADLKTSTSQLRTGDAWIDEFKHELEIGLTETFPPIADHVQVLIDMLRFRDLSGPGGLNRLHDIVDQIRN